MLEIKTPATSANLGPGFDCFGIAWNIFNTFLVERSDDIILEGFEKKYTNTNNLFYAAYKKGLDAIGIEDGIHVCFKQGIPNSRGLGSSASFISAGLIAANTLHGSPLSSQEIFQLASEMEGHPDNAAPCLFGGFQASTTFEGTYLQEEMPFAKDWCATVCIPDFKVSTERARSILPDSYPRAVCAKNGANAVLSAHALGKGDLDLYKKVCADAIHEPYRKTLIHDFNAVKTICEQDTGGVFLISGSGSTCLLLSKKPLSAQAVDSLKSLQHNWLIQSVSVWNQNLFKLGDN